jgi:hypothetical protein
MPGLVREAHMGGIDVGIGVHRNRVDTEALCRAQYPHRYFATVRDQ